MHATEIVLIAREVHASLLELRVTGSDAGLRLLDGRAGLIVRPGIIVIRFLDLRFEAGDIGFRRRKVSLQVP